MSSRPVSARWAIAAIGLGLVAAIAVGACGGDDASGGASRSDALSADPALRRCGTYSGRGCAPANKRVDLARPSFSNPTRITNPLFPISRLHSALLLGHVEGKPFRTETTLLPGAGEITWNGQRIRVLVSQ